MVKLEVPTAQMAIAAVVDHATGHIHLFDSLRRDKLIPGSTDAAVKRPRYANSAVHEREGSRIISLIRDARGVAGHARRSNPFRTKRIHRIAGEVRHKYSPRCSDGL